MEVSEVLVKLLNQDRIGSVSFRDLPGSTLTKFLCDSKLSFSVSQEDQGLDARALEKQPTEGVAGTGALR